MGLERWMRAGQESVQESWSLCGETEKWKVVRGFCDADLADQ